MSVRVRFAPSPTGQVHIGNIRTAIFNWLFTRHEKGKFLLRVEDTDRERSTQDAIDKLLECMAWLGLDYDEDAMYQSNMAASHIEAAEKLLAAGNAYKAESKDGEATPVLFRIPWNSDDIPAVRTVGAAEITVHPDEPVVISNSGINYAAISKKGKPIPEVACLAGFKDLVIVDQNDEAVFELNSVIDDILNNGKSFTIENCKTFKFTRREVFYNDLVKGELAKPLDSIKDLVIVRSDGNPIFHLANVCDDVKQGVTHIVRGDDHVENTYRHILLFHALDYPIPQYAHLPMIVNNQGKPYSKRDGDAFVGDFREKGFLPEALFNYLTLLGWSPGDDREKMSKDELVEAFTLERVKSNPAQFDMNKLQNLNGQYIAEIAPESFAEMTWDVAGKMGWHDICDKDYFNQVAALMQPRTKLVTQIDSWAYFFTDDYEIDMKTAKKALKREGVKEALAELKSAFDACDSFDADSVEQTIRATETKCGFDEGKLNQAVRIAVTGARSGADLYPTVSILAEENVIKRLDKAIALDF